MLASRGAIDLLCIGNKHEHINAQNLNYKGSASYLQTLNISIHDFLLAIPWLCGMMEKKWKDQNRERREREKRWRLRQWGVERWDRNVVSACSNTVSGCGAKQQKIQLYDDAQHIDLEASRRPSWHSDYWEDSVSLAPSLHHQWLIKFNHFVNNWVILFYTPKIQGHSEKYK